MDSSNSPIRLCDETPPCEGARLLLSGRVTVACAGDLHRAAVVLSSRGGNVTVDCSAAEYLDASAIQVLMSLGRELRRAGGTCDIVNVPAAVREDFRLTGFTAGLRQ